MARQQSLQEVWRGSIVIAPACRKVLIVVGPRIESRLGDVRSALPVLSHTNIGIFKPPPSPKLKSAKNLRVREAGSFRGYPSWIRFPVLYIFIPGTVCIVILITLYLQEYPGEPAEPVRAHRTPHSLQVSTT